MQYSHFCYVITAHKMTLYSMRYPAIFMWESVVSGFGRMLCTGVRKTGNTRVCALTAVIWPNQLKEAFKSKQVIRPNSTKILSRSPFWPSLKLIGPLECSKAFSMIRTGDLLFDPTWPSFETDQDFVKDIILTKFEVDWAENVASEECS